MSPPPSGAGLSLDPRLLRLVDWRRYGLGLGLGLLAHAAQLGLAACLVAALLDRPPWAWAAGLLALRLGAALGAEWLAAGLADEAKARARAGLWASSARRGVGEGVAATTTAFVQGVEGLAPYFQRYLPQLGLAALAPALVLVCVLILDPLSGLLLALTAPLLPLFMILIGRKTAQISRRSWGALMAMGRRLFDLLGALEDLVLLGAAPQQIERLKAEGERLRQAASEVLRFAAASALALELIATLSTAIIAVQIGLRALSGGVDLERALLILLFTPELYQPLRALGARFHAGMSGISALEAVATPPTPPPGRAAPVGPLRLDAVSVRYPEDPLRDKALSLISLTIHQGERLAIWGPSGAGKSTLARLILGELSPDEGAISVAGVPLAEIDALAWRAQLGYAPQSPLILGETFASALRMAAPEADDARLEAAARAAGAWGFIAAREGGLLASIGAGGARLSGGERRRLALAQVILRGAPYVVLDEPTAHLDEAARAATLEAISGLRPEGAALIITHDPQLAARCDRVARLERGRLVSIDPPEAIADLAAPIIAAFTPPAPPAPPAPGPALRLIGAWLIQHPLALSAALLLGTGAIGASVGLMGVAGALIVTAAAGPPLAALQMMILGVRALGTLRGPLRYAERLITHDLSFALTGWLRARVFEGLAARAHLDPPRRGAALAQIIEDVDALQRLVIEGLTPPWVALCVLLGVGLAQARLSLTLALITVGGLLAAGLVAAGFGLAEARRGRRLAEAEARLGGAVEGALEAALCVTPTAAAAHVEAATAALLTLQRAATRLEALAGASHEALRWLTTAGALWSVAEAPLPLAVAHTLIALAAFEATAPLAAAASALGRQRHAAARLLSGLDAPPLPIEGPPPIGPLTARVLDLQRPGISTPSGEALSFEITAGEAVAIVGPSGAGKTTLARCLVGLAIPTAGRVEIGGVSPIAARGRVALLGQSPRLIEGTARENLELGAAFTPEARAEALRRVGLGGLDEATPLGVDGRRLSGGERQRLALARLLLRRPGLLILDEPTAHLDAATAQALINALVALRATTTLVWITHDPPPWVTQVIRLGSATRPPPAPSPSDAPSSRMNASP